MKKLTYILPLLFALMFIISSCSNSTDAPPVESGSIYITSNPSGAQIYVDNSLKSVTPDSVTNLSAGSHNITLKLNGYNDTTISVEIIANQKISKHVDLTSNLSVIQYGFTTPIQVWETDDPSSSDPSGIQLSTGNAYGISGTNKDLVDLVYRSSDYNFISASDWTTNLPRVTWFKTGSAASMSDTVSAPVFDAATWTKKIPDNQSNYFFAYDNDHHYSKINSATG